MAVAGSGWGLAQLAEALGSSEQALRLIVSILMGSVKFSLWLPIADDLAQIKSPGTQPSKNLTEGEARN